MSSIDEDVKIGFEGPVGFEEHFGKFVAELFTEYVDEFLNICGFEFGFSGSGKGAKASEHANSDFGFFRHLCQFTLSTRFEREGTMGANTNAHSTAIT